MLSFYWLRQDRCFLKIVTFSQKLCFKSIVYFPLWWGLSEPSQTHSPQDRSYDTRKMHSPSPLPRAKKQRTKTGAVTPTPFCEEDSHRTCPSDVGGRGPLVQMLGKQSRPSSERLSFTFPPVPGHLPWGQTHAQSSTARGQSGCPSLPRPRKPRFLRPPTPPATPQSSRGGRCSPLSLTRASSSSLMLSCQRGMSTCRE